MATTSLGRLTLDLVAQIGQYVGPLNQAERRTVDSTNKMNKAFTSFKDQMNQSLNGSQIGSLIEGVSGRLSTLQGGLLGVTAAAAGMAVGGMVVAAGGLSVLAIETAKANVEMMRFAAISNTSIESFQGLASAAQTFGVTQEQMADQLKDFNEKIGEFTSVGGGEAKDFFEQIAVKTEKGAEGAKKLAEEMSKMDGVTALQTYVDKLEEAGLNQQQMSYYLESMGNDLTKIAPLLLNGGQLWKDYQVALENAGVLTSKEAAEQSMVLAAQTESVQIQFGALKNQLAQAVMPALSGVIGYFLEGSGKGGQFAGIIEAIGIAARGTAALVLGLAGGIKTIVTLITGAMNVFGNLGQTVVNFWNAPTLKGKGMALVDGFVNNGNILVNTAKSVADTAKKAYGSISNVVSSQTGQYDALTQSILNNQKAQQEWAKKGGKGLISGLSQNKELNPVNKMPKNDSSNREADRLRKESERSILEQAKLAKDILYDYGTEFVRIEADLTKEIERINKATLSASEKDKLILEAKSISESRKRIYLLEYQQSVDSWEWSEERKLSKSAEIDKARIDATLGMTKSERDIRKQLIDSIFNYEMNKIYIAKNEAAKSAADNWSRTSSEMMGGDAFYGLGQERSDRYKESFAVFETQSDLLNQQEQDPNADFVLIAQQREAIWQAHTERLKAIDQDYWNKTKAYQLGMAADVFGGLSGVLLNFVDESSSSYRMLIAAQKGANLASVFMSNLTAISAAWSSAPFPANLPAVALTTAETGVLQATLQAFSPQGFATGGHITGKGTGTSDDIPIWASNGEFMIRSAAVEKLGLANLDYINRTGMLPPRQNADFTRAMNERQSNAKQTEAVQQPQVNVRVMNSWDESEFFDAMATPTGEKIVMNIIKRNRTKLRI
ncbi:phage tail tape measure protein [Acinetobacter junii]|uniref:phage tail tape measure protein n=1 Tax=Acinetobacter junii TaxID=40215 RepID=UPI0012505548|nr:phage tail tape measure protein [Acinetobacter junii]